MATTTLPPAAKRAIFEPEHEDYRESFAKFLAKEVTPRFDEWDQAGIVPRELFTKAAAHGFLAMAVPEEHGGPGVADFRFNVVLIEEAARAGVGAAFAGPMLHTDVCLPYILSGATPEQKQRWLPGIASGERILAIAMTEPGTGSDLAAVQTRARREGDVYVLSGQKTFITNGINCDQVIVVAKTDPDAAHAGMSLLVVDAESPGFKRGRQIDKLGQHASDTAELFFDDVRVPVENLLGAEGSGFMQLMQKLVPERLTLAVASIAGAEHVLDITLEYVKQRKAFGRPIGSFQNSRFVMAELKTEITITRTFVDDLIRRHCEGEVSIEEAAMAKWWTTELLGRVTDRCLQLHGGYGYTREYEISQAWVDARITRIYAGTTEIMKELIGRSMGL
ncbi:acyl-CoA dehydrogenase [Conexibacter sp. W3-3-2]|uniref:acyl-CoA dehydrogenase family protein n=1 Tax=Conexibacter sp. W3-3-2 TaxID=2675227 RepID=UPI0012B79434|nr:acyl-CoA dehydrogenase family protein [Conexibacter sp. W3-3-2]MTD47776.1 acyl-CoA dehydrogenase [Conexibacter sp. W3-3-2]